MTSPSWPVSSNPPPPLPFASVAVASTNSTSPPVPVTASPVATPGTAVRAATSLSNFGLPRNSRTRSGVIATGGVSWPVATLVATLRVILPSSRSRLRTPASRVWSVITFMIAASSTVTSSVFNPACVICRRSRWSRAIATFSSSVYPSRRISSMRSCQRDDRARTAAAQDFQPALRAQLANGEELDDPVLHVAEACVVLVEDLARLLEVVVVFGAHVPGDVEHPVEVGADPPVLGVLLARPLQAVELAVDLGQHRLRHLSLRDSVAVGRDDVGLAFVQLLLDRLELLAQEELPLRLLHALGDIAADLLLERSVGQDALGPLDERGQPLLEVDRLQDLQLLLGGQVGRVACEVGQVAGRPGGAQELHDLRDAA